MHISTVASTLAKRFTAVANVVIPVFAVVAIVSRLMRLGGHLAPLDVVAVVASLFLVTGGLVAFLRGHKKRGVTLMLVDATLAAFLFFQVDLPWARDVAPTVVQRPLLEITASVQDLRGDHYGAAYLRVAARSNEQLLGYSAITPKALLEKRDGCAKLEHFATVYLKSEPLIANTLMRQRGACAAAAGDTDTAIRFYLAGNDGADSYRFAATLAAFDGFPNVAVAAIRAGLASPSLAIRTQSCRQVSIAYDDVRFRAVPLHKAIRDGKVEPCRQKALRT